ncbi:MAG: PilT/PilU family type 4a pilus ATPase [Lentisphaeraceae bacterium]|nr:PilT/PilU family type 4a pilus ATPase [Lentisphaeraceae bacterium]
MNNEIDWLCTLGVGRGVFTVEQVRALYEISPPETTLMEFAQGTLDNGFTDNMEALQEIIEEASRDAAQVGACPESVLVDNPPPAPEIAPEPDFASAPEIAPEPERVESPLDTVVGVQNDAPRRKIAFPGASSAPRPPLPGDESTKEMASPVQPGMDPLKPIPAPGASAPLPTTPAPAASPAPSTPAPASAGGYVHTPSGGSYPFDISGFPNMSDVEQNPETAADLMKQFLKYARSIQASDVHISACSHPHIRRFAVNYLIDNQPVLSEKAAELLNMALISETQVQAFRDNLELDYSADFGNNDRYRVNIMRHYRGTESSFRIVSDSIKTLAELGFRNPEVIEKLTTYHQGLILVTGPAGAGKTTTLASLVELINKSREDHIISVEDPVEILVPSKGCNVTQRELHSSTKSFANALRAALREDPDIIVIGEMRDLETIEMAISAAETGHLVIGTLHTSSAAATLDRLLDVFPPGQQSQIRSMLAESLKGVICQQLVPNVEGTKLLMAPEILIGTLAVGKLIKEGKTFQLGSIIETGSKKGMIPTEESFLDLYREGLITYEVTKPQVTTLAKLKQLDMMHQAGGAQAFAQQQAMAAEASDSEPKKKGWFK